MDKGLNNCFSLELCQFRTSCLCVNNRESSEAVTMATDTPNLSMDSKYSSHGKVQEK